MLSFVFVLLLKMLFLYFSGTLPGMPLIHDSDRLWIKAGILSSWEVKSRMAITQQCHLGRKWFHIHTCCLRKLCDHYNWTADWIFMWWIQTWQEDGKSGISQYYIKSLFMYIDYIKMKEREQHLPDSCL